jgi:arylsulfatase
VFGAYLAYTDHEISRVIQAVDDMGKLNDTLIFYISGDNGASSEGTINGTPNEFTFFNGVTVPVEPQLQFYDAWGSDQTFPHYAAGWAWALSTPFKWVKQVASHFGGTRQGMCISWPGAGAHHRYRRRAHAVPPRHRHRADNSRSDGHCCARNG